MNLPYSLNTFLTIYNHSLKSDIKSISQSVFKKIGSLFLLFAILFCHVSISSGQDHARITGQVLDNENRTPIDNTLVFLLPGTQFAETDEDGKYEINQIPPGNYQIVLQRIGYQLLQGQEIDLNSGDSKTIDFYLHEQVFTSNEAIVVTATRGQSTTMDIPQSIDVVTPERVKMVSPINLSEVLNNLQGTYIRNYGSLGALKTVSLRGSSAEQVLLLRDGQKLNNPQTGQIDLSTLSLDGIEQVEILRGGSSAMYGADAVGGVINLITRKKKRQNGIIGSLKLLGGSFNTRSLGASLRIKQDWIKGMLAYQRLRSDGDFTYNDLDGITQHRENNDLSSHNVFSEFNFSFGESPYRTDLDLSYGYYTAERGTPGMLTFPSKVARQQDGNHRVQAILRGRVFSLLNSYQIQTYWHTNKTIYDNIENPITPHTENTSAVYGVEANLKSVLTPYNTLSYGLGIREEWIKGNQFPENHKRKILNVFIQDEAEVGLDLFKAPVSLGIIPALRFDNDSDFGSRWSPKIGTNFSFGSEWQTAIKFNSGWSFRAPTFNELYWPADMWSSGNAELKPESGFDWDLGLSLRYLKFYNFVFNIVYFDIWMDDLIQWKSIDFIYMPVNVSKARNRGIEVSSSLHLFQNMINISGNYTFLNARNLSDDQIFKNKILVYRPRHSFNTTLNLLRKSFTFGFDYRHVGSRYADVENNSKMKSYNISDFRFQYTPDISRWQPTLTFQIKNLFNEKYEVIQYQPIPGREYRIGLGITYN